eukprot:CAMPEP_0198529576 /NCGR_PEP_ID=MMETSP1462-20131121/25833_1 /TAXON_ID=1333877 /ORGANISM="Brandtodinium nutriculum, Strain RCC3387" /LENGTH=179 /DNA_ID=CAMNT_0044259427 /DNA_START=590 /DNA_END=1126 /DNA_ORIENTATION=+
MNSDESADGNGDSGPPPCEESIEELSIASGGSDIDRSALARGHLLRKAAGGVDEHTLRDLQLRILSEAAEIQSLALPPSRLHGDLADLVLELHWPRTHADTRGHVADLPRVGHRLREDEVVAKLRAAQRHLSQAVLEHLRHISDVARLLHVHEESVAIALDLLEDPVAGEVGPRVGRPA